MSAPEIVPLDERIDDKDLLLIEGWLEHRRELESVLVGDWIRCTDGVLLRVAYTWADLAQTEDGGGSYHLCPSGNCSMSGSLDTGLPIEQLTPTQETHPGRAWIFHHNWAQAYNGVSFEAQFTVWEYDGPSADAK